MKKSDLLNYVGRYHLAGATTSVKWVAKDGKLETEFITDDQNVIGTVKADNLDFGNNELGVYATPQLVKMLSAVGDDLNVDVSAVDPGKTITVLWRGKPVFIRRRTPEEIAEAKAVKMEDLKHPEKDEDRAKDPEWLVMLGVCTHLGCVPLDQKGDYNGWFCPCHGSHYDTSGRIRKGPAPTNMEIPEYKFVDANTIKIG